MTDLELAEALHRGAVDETIDPDLERQLSFESGLSLKEIQLAALKEGLTPQRFERNMGTLGREGQIKLLRSTVAVAGCGGLGGLIIDLLARSGVGMMHIADGDTFAPSNLNRQILSSEEHLGKEKAATAAERVRSINEALEVRLFGGYLDEKSIGAFSSRVVGNGEFPSFTAPLEASGARSRSSALEKELSSRKRPPTGVSRKRRGIPPSHPPLLPPWR